MKRYFYLLIFVATTQVAAADLLTDITDGKFRPKPAAAVQSMNDGAHYTTLENNRWIVRHSYQSGKAVDTLFDAGTTKLHQLPRITGYTLSPNEQKILVYNAPTYRYRRTFTAEYHVFDIRRNELKPLSENGAQEAPLFSPDSRYIAFARQNNLYLHKLDFGTESPITQDGEWGKIINGTPDWVYEEEFDATRYFVFSPDSKLLAFVRFDETAVPIYQMQQYMNSPITQDSLPLYPTFRSFKYPKAGQRNTTVSVCVYDDFYKSVKTIRLGTTDTDFYIPRMVWTARQEQLAIFVLNRNQNRLDMLIAHPKSLETKLILREEDERYVDYRIIDEIRFTPSGDYFTFVSERTGWRHAYLYRSNGTLAQQLTSGDFDVTHLYGYDEKSRTLYFQSAEQSPLQRDIYTVNANGKKQRLTTEKGTHTAHFSADFSYFIHTFSADRQPPVVTLRSGKGAALHPLETNEKLLADFTALQLPEKEFFGFTTTGGVQLNGWMLKPVGFDVQKKYPVLMMQYSGPDSQQVRDSWNIGWEYALASEGFVVVTVDGRGTGGRGAEFRKCTYMQLGVLETTDQVETAKYLATLAFVDKNRMGIWGWSYGGFMVLNAMSADERVFKAGIAVAPVTDWRLYNTAYTERYMRQPKANVGGYDAGSPLKRVEKLTGNLLIIHGTADDNVHVQNTYLYLDALRKAGKQADLFLYTDKNHSLPDRETRRHLFRLKMDFLKRNL